MEHSFAERAAARRKDMVAQVARTREERRAFEFERDRSLPPYRRAEAIWGLVRDLVTLRGEDGTQLRLDRSVARVERRRR
jgi:hypothetical protein